MAIPEQEMTVKEGLGYPKAFAELCRSPGVLSPFSQGPPHSFVPYVLYPQEASRLKEMNQMFPIIDPEAKPFVNPSGFADVLWKQLDHLGNAGFDPADFRVDPYGNVLYLHADSGSPLAWDIDHWFPLSRGGKTVPSNLRLMQWQVCRKKHNKLDFLIPWWDLQLGISVNQFLSVFASRNSDFRNRAFSFFFSNGGSEELTSLQPVESHSFPQHFINMKRQVGLAPAAIVSSQQSTEESVLKTLDSNRAPKSNSTMKAANLPSKALQIFRPNISKENEQPINDGYSCNPHLSITIARDSLRQMEETKIKQAEINQLDDELNQLKKKNEAERLVLQELEEVLIKRRRRVEKCRRLAEAQSSYRAMLEKMIRDAMHQCVVYKEQLRLNTAASSSLMARLEAQRAMADSSEHELRRKFKQRDEIEKQIRPCWGPRKRSRMDDILFEERNYDNIELATTTITSTHRHPKKELRQLLEEAHKASEAELSVTNSEEDKSRDESSRSNMLLQDEEKHRRLVDSGDHVTISEKLEKLVIRACKTANDQQKSRLTGGGGGGHDDDEYMKQVGKGNIDNWLKIMLDNAGEGTTSTESPPMNPKNDPSLGSAQTENNCEMKGKFEPNVSRKSFEVKERKELKGREIPKCESSRGFRSLPSSPSVMLGMRRGVECIGMKPRVIGDEECGSKESGITGNKFMKSCTKVIKKVINK